MILDAFRLDGRVALVTGASRGIGAALAVGLAEAGADVACHGHTRSADATCVAITALGRRAFTVRGNLAESAIAARVTAQTRAALGPIDILVNNAGVIRRAPAVDHGEDFWVEVLETNLSSVFRLSQAVGRACLAEGRPGKIVNIASLLSFQGGVNVVSYAVAKGGVAQLTKALANEWSQSGIQVNAIAPGYIRTDNTAALQADPVRYRQILDRIPSGRWGEPSDLTGAAVFLASRASDYVTGHVLVVDGGWMAR